MPRRTPRRRPSSPENDFFNELLDSVLDSVLDVVEPHFEKLAKDAVGNARRLIDRQQQAQAPPPPPPPRTRGFRTQPPPPPPPPKPQLYEILEVSPRASQETIEAAYKSLARRYHPDVNKNKTGEIMKHINMAYQVLNDPGKRAAYNRSVGLA
jgi:hypothetical protein